MKFKRYAKKGFTLIELIVVMAVLAILVTLGAPRFLGYTKDAEVTAMKADSKLIEQAAYQYALKNDDIWPTAEPVTSIDEEVKDIIAAALVDRGAVADQAAGEAMVDALISANAFCKIDEAKIQPFIRSTKRPVNSYFIVNRVSGVSGYNNELEGMVFSVTALQDSEGHIHSGLYEVE